VVAAATIAARVGSTDAKIAFWINWVLTKPIYIIGVGNCQVVGGSGLGRSRDSTIEMTIKIVSSHDHGHLGLPQGEVMAASKFNRKLGNRVELNNGGTVSCIRIGN